MILEFPKSMPDTTPSNLGMPTEVSKKSIPTALQRYARKHRSTPKQTFVYHEKVIKAGLSAIGNSK